MRIKAKYIGGIISLGLTIWGIPSLGDNWKQWKALSEWCAPHMSPENLRTTISAVGMLGLGLLLISERWKRRPSTPGARQTAEIPPGTDPVKVTGAANPENGDSRTTPQAKVIRQARAISLGVNRDRAIAWRKQTATLLRDTYGQQTADTFLADTANIEIKGQALKATIEAAKRHLKHLAESPPVTPLVKPSPKAVDSQLIATAPKSTSITTPGGMEEKIEMDRKPTTIPSINVWTGYIWNRSKIPVAISVQVISIRPALSPDVLRLPSHLPFGAAPEKEIIVAAPGDASSFAICQFVPSETENALFVRGKNSFVRIPKENYELTVMAFTKNGASATITFRMIDAESHGGIIVVG
jgi:hypothetical protein